MTPSVRRREPGRAPGSGPSTPATLVALAVLLYFAVPLCWLVIAATKDTDQLFTSFGLWFGDHPALWDNVRRTLTHRDGVFVQWLVNSLFYSVVSGATAAVLSTAAGYGFAKFEFPGRDRILGGILATIMVPNTALAIPTYLLFSRAGLINTPWAIVLPSAVSPFGVFLMRIYARQAVPDEMIEAARLDGAGELCILFRIAARLLAPGAVTVALFTLVGTWNNFLLPLIMLNDPELYPVTVGLSSWSAQATNGGGGASAELLPLVVTGSLLSVLPLLLAVLMLQRFWQSGLAGGGLRE